MKVRFFLLMVLITGAGKIQAQDSTRFRIAIFAPLYLDSAFDVSGVYRYAKNEFPKFINPGLEMYEGARLALDSLGIEKAPLDVYVYDTRSATESLSDQLNRPELDSVSFIIANCSASEVRIFADAGLKHHIPVINVNMPNDGGVTENPYFILLNPTLRTQCEGIYRYLQKYHALDPIVVFRKKGQLEDRVQMYLDDFGKTTVSVPLTLKYVDLPENFTEYQLRAHLDTINQTVCLAGSLDENFGRRLVQQLASLKKQKYQAIAVGMPTWDNIRDFSKPEYKGVEIVYSTPFYNPKTDKVSNDIINYFNRVMYARPSDMVFRGYEVTWKYARLLMHYKKDFNSNISNKRHTVFTEFDIQPVLDRQTMALDYFENKKLYFLKWQDGVLKGVY
ncbi:MAG: amino acid ABC transporter substrate-binding protein [Chitinophagaceae bacterium]